jgi:pyruvate-formate lyase-activating enzyme
MTVLKPAPGNPLDPAKFSDPDITAAGERRAKVALTGLRTLWFNTGTLCNLACSNCYIDSSPTNDRLVYLTLAEVDAFLDEIERDAWPVAEIAFTGGEPFMNPALSAMLDSALARGFRALVLTNAMRPMMKCAEPLLALRHRFGDRLCLRVSLDHYDSAMHELVRGKRSWRPAIEGFKWLSDNGFHIHAAARACWNEPDAQMRAGFAALFAREGIRIDTSDPVRMMILPEMNATLDVPEITERCWGILGVSPEAMMCASSRMVVKRKGAERPVVVPCTLLPYDEAFDMGHTLAEASGAVSLNHPHCARFCVLGGGACSRGAD